MGYKSIYESCHWFVYIATDTWGLPFAVGRDIAEGHMFSFLCFHVVYVHYGTCGGRGE